MDHAFRTIFGWLRVLISLCRQPQARRQRTILFALALPCATASALSPDQLTTTSFLINNDTGFGFSAFVSGTVPELGTNANQYAPKLTWNTGNNWQGGIGLPPATSFTYKFMRRADDPANIGTASNGTVIGSAITTTTASNPALNLPATKTIYYYSGWSPVWVQVQDMFAGGGAVEYSMTDVGPGRTVGERLWRATGFATPGRAVRYIFTNHIATTDPNPSTRTPYETFLDVALVQDGNVYNYVPATSVSPSRIDVINSVASPQGLQTRSLRVYVPRGYNEHSTRRYPVLYMHDGQNIYGTTSPTFPNIHWNIDGTLDWLISNGQVRETIVVGIDNTSARNTDYTPPGAPSGGISGGQGDKYAAYVRDTVKPLIDATYRTKPDRANTGTAGSSLGGLIATYQALQHPATYSRIGSFSPAYWANPTATSDRFPTEPTLPVWRHYLSCGTTGATSGGSPDGYNTTVAARDALLRRGQPVNIQVLNDIGFGEQHNEQAWQNRFPTAARFLFPIEDEGNLSGFPSGVADWKAY